MKLLSTLTLLFCLFVLSISSQENKMKYEVSKENPFGKYNPKAPKQLQDYKDLIGECKCTSESRKLDGS